MKENQIKVQQLVCSRVVGRKGKKGTCNMKAKSKSTTYCNVTITKLIMWNWIIVGMESDQRRAELFSSGSLIAVVAWIATGDFVAPDSVGVDPILEDNMSGPVMSINGIFCTCL